MTLRSPARPAAAWWLLLLPALLAAAIPFAALAWTSDGFTAGGRFDAFEALVVLGNVGPGLLLAGITVAALRAGGRPRTRMSLLVGNLVLLVVVALTTADVVWSDSSTSALGFLFFPAVTWTVVVVVGVVTVLLSSRGAQP